MYDEIWHKQAETDYKHWCKADNNIADRMDRLLASIKKTPFEGLGKPEPLKYNLHGWWSRRITDEHRLIYRIREDMLEILSCREHY